MHTVPLPGILFEKRTIESIALGREVILDCYLSLKPGENKPLDLLLINDGQNLEEMNFTSIVQEFQKHQQSPLLILGIHAGPDRKREYGIAGLPDYKGRGDKASAYTSFIMGELLPYLQSTFSINGFGTKAFAGFSLGGLTALDIVWNHPGAFNVAGVFSGSLWWRSIAQEDEHYNDHKHRIMHQLVRNGTAKTGMKFYFQCGNKDEVKDRNGNGIIDSIDDTIDLVKELEAKGYTVGDDIKFVLMEEGRHDIPTWGMAFPGFVDWAFNAVGTRQ
jgi:enterochelin esterase-like enzyme